MKLAVRWCVAPQHTDACMAAMRTFADNLAFPPWLPEDPRPRVTDDPAAVDADDTVVWLCFPDGLDADAWAKVAPRFNRIVLDSMPPTSLDFLASMSPEERVTVRWALPPPHHTRPRPPSSLRAEDVPSTVDYLLHAFPAVVEGAADVVGEWKLLERQRAARKQPKGKKGIKGGKGGKGGQVQARARDQALALAGGLLGQLAAMYEGGVDWEVPVDAASRRRLKTLADAATLAAHITHVGMSFSPDEARSLVLSRLSG